MPVPTIRTFQTTAGSQAKDAQIALMAAKGVSDENIYPISIDPTTGALVVSSSLLLDFGATTTAPRQAAVIGAEDTSGTFAGLKMSTQRNLMIAALVPEQWLGMTGTEASSTQETYEFFYDAAKTSAICTVTVDYSDDTKEFITSITRA